MRLPSILHFPSSILALVFALPAAADDGWSLTTADFARQMVNVKALDDHGATVQHQGKAQPAQLPWDQILQFDRGASAAQAVRGVYTLYLVSGDRVGGEPVGISNDNVAWKSPAAGELTIPLKDVRGLVRGAEPPQFDAARTEDVVYLNNGDNVRGIVTGLEGGKLAVKQPSGDVLPLDLASAKAIHFAAAKGENLTGRAFRVQLADGSVVTAPKVRLAADGKLTLSFGAGNDRSIDVGQVVLIEQLNGPVSWLSARVPADVLSLPMLDTPYPPQMDRNYVGEKLKFSGREYSRGIGVHAYARLTYALEGQGFKAFRTQYAMNENSTKGRVTVRILLDDKVVHEAKDFPPGKLASVVVIELGNAKTLSLEAHPGGDTSSADPTKWHSDVQARLNWIEPALLRAVPQPEPKPEVKPEAKVEPKKVESPNKDGSKPESKQAEKVAPTPEANPGSKGEPKRESKPEPATPEPAKPDAPR